MPQQPFYNAIPTPQPRGNPAVWVILGVLLAIVVFGAILFAATFAITGNAVRNATTNTGPVTTDTQSIPVGSNTSAGIDLNMGAGDIAVMGGSANLVDATFVYNVPGWKPNAVFNIQGNSGTFQVSQPDVRNISGNMRNEWTLRLSNKIPADVKINLGAGNVDVRLGGVPAKTLNIDNHAGNTTVDLTGQWKNNLDATVTNALGNATIRVPSDVGVRITTHRGLGNITADGLKANGNVYTNDAYGKSAVTLNIDATVNLGNLVMVAEKEMKTQGD